MPIRGGASSYARIAVVVRSLVVSTIFKLRDFSDARTSIKFIAVMLAVLIPTSLIFFATSARSTVNIITVNNLTDPVGVAGNGFCTLREAINNANASGDMSGGDCTAGNGNDFITFSVSGTLTLTHGAFRTIANTLTIDGTGQSITIDAGFISGILQTQSGANLTVKVLTLAHGNTTLSGGGIDNESGTLTVDNCHL